MSRHEHKSRLEWHVPVASGAPEPVIVWDLAVRVFHAAWGFIGSRHARFRDFVRTPRTVLAYLRAQLASRSRRYIGHNPAGGYMILALLALISVICATGIMQLTNRYYGVEWVEMIHHFAANALLVLVLHWPWFRW